MRILLLGANGQVGWELQRALAPLGEIVAPTRSQPGGSLDDIEGLAAFFRKAEHYDVIANAAAWTAVDAAEGEPDGARVANALAPEVLAHAAAATGALLLHYSTDYVFDGSGTVRWREEDPTGPLNVYGRTKLEGEQLIRESGCRHLIFRTSWVYAARGRNFLRTMLRMAAEREVLRIVDDQHGAPTPADLIADVSAHALRATAAGRRIDGTYHLVAEGATTWYGFATHAIECARDAKLPVRAALSIEPCATIDFPTPAQRPCNSRLDTTRLQRTFDLHLPDWKIGVTRAVWELAGR